MILENGKCVSSHDNTCYEYDITLGCLLKKHALSNSMYPIPVLVQIIPV